MECEVWTNQVISIETRIVQQHKALVKVYELSYLLKRYFFFSEPFCHNFSFTRSTS